MRICRYMRHLSTRAIFESLLRCLCSVTHSLFYSATSGVIEHRVKSMKSSHLKLVERIDMRPVAWSTSAPRYCGGVGYICFLCCPVARSRHAEASPRSARPHHSGTHETLLSKSVTLAIRGLPQSPSRGQHWSVCQ
jgi:hypothetical protein